MLAPAGAPLFPTGPPKAGKVVKAVFFGGVTPFTTFTAFYLAIANWPRRPRQYKFSLYVLAFAV